MYLYFQKSTCSLLGLSASQAILFARHSLPPFVCLKNIYYTLRLSSLVTFSRKWFLIFSDNVKYTLYVCILPSPTTAITVASVTWFLPVLSPTGTQRFGRLGPFYHILLDSFIFVHQCFHLLGCVQQEAVSRSGESSFIQ